MRKFLLIFFIIVLFAGITLFLTKDILLGKLESFLIEKIETSTGMGIKIEDIAYRPVKGIRLEGISIYKDKEYKEKTLFISQVYIKFPFKELVKERIFSPTITVDNLEINKLLLKGAFSFSLKVNKKYATTEELLDGIEDVELEDISVKNDFLSISKINGKLDISSSSIKSSDLSFLFDDEPCKMEFEVNEPLGEVSSQIKLSSSKLNLDSEIKKEKEIYKIPKLDGNLYTSTFNLIGEVENPKDPILSLHGKAKVNLADIINFVPEDSRKNIKKLNLRGKINNSIYFKGSPKDLVSSELGIKSTSSVIKIKEYSIDDLFIDTRLKNGKIQIPVLTASPHKGALESTIQIDLNDKLLPYYVDCDIANVDINSLLRNTELGKRNITGLFSTSFTIQGDIKDIDTTKGSGNIKIKNANLGPMPLLTPLLGSLYGYFQSSMPGLKSVDITRGKCDFVVKKRKIKTNNLILWGDVVSINAKGYIDFDTNLNFEVENEFVEPDPTKPGDWQTDLQELISTVGKFVSKAYLTGTLENPKWKFQYGGGMEDFLKGGLNNLLKGVFQE